MRHLKFEFIYEYIRIIVLKDAGKYFYCVMLRATVLSAPQFTCQ